MIEVDKVHIGVERNGDWSAKLAYEMLTAQTPTLLSVLVVAIPSPPALLGLRRTIHVCYNIGIHLAMSNARSTYL